MIDELPAFDRQVKVLAMPEAAMTRIETRTLCPLRIPRSKAFLALKVRDLYCSGEGALNLARLYG